MKDVYVIKVKTKPPLSSLYPSERRYSSSTVGGLSLVHLGLSILAFLLGSLARSLQGPVLSFACLVPFASGLLAWRRWYIDKNISFFFYGSIFSLFVSTLCGLATAFDIAAVTENGIGPGSWRIEETFRYPEIPGAEKRLVRIVERNETDDGLDVLDAGTKQDCNETLSGIKDPGVGNVPGNSSSRTDIEDRYFFAGFRNGILSLWRGDVSSTSRNSILLDVNVLVTCVLEICWSLLSVKISLRGMRNRNVDTSYDNNGPYKARRIKPRAPDPAAEDRVHSYDENLRNFNPGYSRGNSTNDNSGPRLPLPESNKEFRERVERFLANQAAHRIVEGSCS